MSNVKKIPYGVSNFTTIMTKDYYYVDKTKYIPIIESQPDFLFFTRPRRFGKSLWIDMLSTYYDCKKKDRFDELFGSLWIGSNKTEQQGMYQMLILDFSKVGGNMDTLPTNFNKYTCARLDCFIRKYGEAYPDDIVKAILVSDDANEKLVILDSAASDLGIELFLIIDEYDNFTNTVLNEYGEEVYHAITHTSGFYRDVFKKFKGMFRRIIMAGVSPVTLDDLTSGYNIGWNITTIADFNQMLGFSEEEVHEMFAYYKEAGALPAYFDIEKTIAEIKPWYDDYCFSQEAYESQSKVFNSDMVLFYVSNLINYKRPPKQMLDRNTGTDYSRLKNLLQLDKLDGDRKGVLHKIIEEGLITDDVEESFPAYMLTEPRMFASLLFYYGMLTIKGSCGLTPVLGIPNNNVRKLYYNYLIEEYEGYKNIGLSDLAMRFLDMAKSGKWRECLQYLADAYASVSSVRDGIEGERNIQGFFMAYLSTNKYYRLAPELELNHGYCDFFLLPDITHYTETRHSYIIELKYLPKKDFGDKASGQWKDAIAQIGHYAAAPQMEILRQGTTLHKIIMQFCGYELRRMEEIS